MAALSGAQPAQRSAGPKRAAWQRALFRFPIPNRRKGVLRHTLLPFAPFCLPEKVGSGFMRCRCGFILCEVQWVY